MPRSSHRPIRTCLGCREADEKSLMVRVAAAGAAIELDPQGRLGGRGGYLHRRPECLERFVKAKVREFRSLRRSIDRQARIGLAEGIGRLAINATRDYNKWDGS